MAYFTGNIYSYALDKMTPIAVYLPQDDQRRFNISLPMKTLILLHGLEGNYSYWGRYTSVERYAQKYNLALVMPDGEMSMYTNMRCGQNYAEYIGQELPELIKSLFVLPTNRESLSIAGLSMGGYGALKIALTYPDTFGRCAAFSGAFHLGDKTHLEKLSSWKDMGRGEIYIEADEINRSIYHGCRGAFGDDFMYAPEDDILYLAQKAVAGNVSLPRLLLTCGTEDFLYETNLQYSKELKELGIAHRFVQWAGLHDWKFWEECVRDHLSFFTDDL